MEKVVGVDTGGTFTDFVVLGREGLRAFKLLSTPEDPSRAVLEGLSDISPTRVVHGSTVATNTFLERKGAKVAFITNRGFEDVVFIGRQVREDLYRLDYRRPPHILERDMVFGVDERTLRDGTVEVNLKEEELEELKKKILEKGSQAVAIGLLFSFKNPGNELRIKKYFKDLPYVFTSSEVSPEYREYERFITTIVNAYLAPSVVDYLSRLRAGLGRKVWVMASSGGVVSVEEASSRPVELILSGPVGGVVAARYYGSLWGEDRVISFDMGGTSTDVSLIEGGYVITKEKVLSGIPIRVSAVDVHTIGAGGGSIAYVDMGGALKVGPRSAGARPGPICYGFGGKEPTVTDANLILGRIPKTILLAGKYRLDFEKAFRVFSERAKEWGFEDPYELALGIVEVVNSNMERALKTVSLGVGRDPADFALVAFGGSGPLHACQLAQSLGIKKVIIPPYPGMFSALGMVLTDWVKERSWGVLEVEPGDKVSGFFKELEERLRKEFEDEGVTGEIIFERFLEARFEGQSYEIRVPWRGSWSLFKEEFEKEHKDFYGYVHSGRVEVVNVVVRGVAPSPFKGLPRWRGKKVPNKRKTEVFLDGKFLYVPFYFREELCEGFSLEGPAVLSDVGSTFYLPPGWRCKIDGFGGIVAEGR